MQQKCLHSRGVVHAVIQRQHRIVPLLAHNMDGVHLCRFDWVAPVRQQNRNHPACRVRTNLCARVPCVCEGGAGQLRATAIRVGLVVVGIPPKCPRGLANVVHSGEAMHCGGVQERAAVCGRKQQSPHELHQVVHIAEDAGMPCDAPQGKRVLVAHLSLRLEHAVVVVLPGGWNMGPCVLAGQKARVLHVVGLKDKHTGVRLVVAAVLQASAVRGVCAAGVQLLCLDVAQVMGQLSHHILQGDHGQVRVQELGPGGVDEGLLHEAGVCLVHTCVHFRHRCV